MGDRQTAALLVLLSAFSHAAWNLAARAVKGETAVMVLGLSTVAPVCLLAANLVQELVQEGGSGGSDRDSAAELRTGLPYILITGAVHALYVVLLAHAYKIGDIVVVYPVARGSSVVFVALLSRLFIPDEPPMSALGLVGIAVVVAGVGAMAVKGEDEDEDEDGEEEELRKDAGAGADEKAEDEGLVAAGGAAADADADESTPGEKEEERGQTVRAIGFALVVGSCTAAYSIDDAIGVTIVDPLLYQLGNCLVMACFTLPYMLCSAARKEAMKVALRTQKKFAAGIGIGGSGTYLIVLYAFRMAGKAPLIVALRQISIAFAAILGRFVLGEELTRPKIAGVVLITGGVAIVQYADG